MNTHSIGAFLPLLCVEPVLGPFYAILCVLCVGTYAGKNGLKEHWGKKGKLLFSTHSTA